MIFLPDGSIVGKEHMRSCEDCLISNILKWQIYAGKILPIDEDDDANSDDDGAYNHEQVDDNQHEVLKMRGKCIFDAVEKGATIALFSPPSSSELFYRSKMLDMKVAKEDICDIYNHAVSKGDKHTESQYYKKSAKNKEFIQYKLLKLIVYVLPHHVSMPVVNMTNDMRFTTQEHLFISNCC